MSDPLAFGAPAEETTDLVDLQLGGPAATEASDPLFLGGGAGGGRAGEAPATATTAAAPAAAAAADPLLSAPAVPAVAPAVVETSSAWDAFASGAPAPAAAVPAAPPAYAVAAPAAAATPATAAPAAAAAPAPAHPQHQHQNHHQPPATPLLVVQVSDPVRREGAGGGGFFGAATGGGSHVEYLVTSATSAPGGLPGWRAPTVSVRRRFRDAVALADLLKTTHRGYFVPPRPDKNAAEGGSLRQSDAFIEERRLTLERWLNRLAAHPAVGPSDALRVFLEAEGDLSRDYRWLALQPPPPASVLEGASRAAQQLLGRESRAVDPVAAAQPASRSMDLLRAVREAATQARAPGGALAGVGGASAGGSLASSAYMGQAAGGAGGGYAPGEPNSNNNGHAYGGGSVLLREGGGMPEGEAALRAARARAEDVREALSAASRAAEALVAAQEGCAQGAAELGAALFRLARLEEGAPGAAALTAATAASGGGGGGDAAAAAAAVAAAEVAGALVADPKRAAGACVRAAKLRERAVARAAADLGKLHEWLALMPAVTRGLASREHQLLTAATLQDDLAQRKAQLAVLEAGGGAAAPASASFGTAARRAEELRGDAARLELSCSAARREYERLAEVNRAELARVARERASELAGGMLEGLAATQAAAAERALEIWLALAQELRCDPARLAPLRSALTTAMGGAV